MIHEIVKRTFTKGKEVVAIDHTPSNQDFPEYFPPLDYDKMTAENIHTGETVVYLNNKESDE